MNEREVIKVPPRKPTDNSRSCLLTERPTLVQREIWSEETSPSNPLREASLRGTGVTDLGASRTDADRWVGISPTIVELSLTVLTSAFQKPDSARRITPRLRGASRSRRYGR